MRRSRTSSIINLGEINGMTGTYSSAHDHVFLGEGHEHNESRTWMVIGLCTFMMIAEIVGGFLLGPIALVADGLHSPTHAPPLLLAALASRYPPPHSHHPTLPP